jgi:hypothetical protein
MLNVCSLIDELKHFLRLNKYSAISSSFSEEDWTYIKKLFEEMNGMTQTEYKVASEKSHLKPPNKGTADLVVNIFITRRSGL